MPDEKRNSTTGNRGRSVAAIAERRTVQKSGFQPENWYLGMHAQSMPEQRERHSEHWPQVLDMPLRHTRGKNLKSAGRKAVGVQVPLRTPDKHIYNQ